jgi:hypothetical protein
MATSSKKQLAAQFAELMSAHADALTAADVTLAAAYDSDLAV